MELEPPKIDWGFFSVAGLLGSLIGLGQLLNAQEVLTWRVVIGRALVSAGLAAMSPIILIWFPHLPVTVEFAVAAMLASLGTSGLQLLVHKALGRA